MVSIIIMLIKNFVSSGKWERMSNFILSNINHFSHLNNHQLVCECEGYPHNELVEISQCSRRKMKQNKNIVNRSRIG